MWEWTVELFFLSLLSISIFFLPSPLVPSSRSLSTSNFNRRSCPIFARSRPWVAIRTLAAWARTIPIQLAADTKKILSHLFRHFFVKSGGRY
ncbi:hypothetical protein J3E68DRAFT_408588 [Trichoderma sp. SZMC 28012]